MDLFRQREWKDDARCNGLSAWEADSLFYNRGKSPKPAQEFCSHCLVQTECLTEALENNELGIWSGVTEKDRDNMLKHQKIIVTSHIMTTKRSVIAKDKPVVMLISSEAVELEVGLFELEGPTDTDLLAM